MKCLCNLQTSEKVTASHGLRMVDVWTRGLGIQLEQDVAAARGLRGEIQLFVRSAPFPKNVSIGTYVGVCNISGTYSMKYLVLNLSHCKIRV